MAKQLESKKERLGQGANNVLGFECLKCCDCCKNLLHNEHGLIRGLTLLPEETYLFSQEHIFPSAGVGQYRRAKKIVTYQLGLDMCPHLQGQRCVIYDRRPLACQIYPFLIETLQPLRVTVEEHCRWFKEKVVAKGLEKKFLTSKEGVIAPMEIEACLNLYERLGEFEESKNKWWFDLRRKAWFSVG